MPDLPRVWVYVSVIAIVIVGRCVWARAKVAFNESTVFPDVRSDVGVTRVAWNIVIGKGRRRVEGEVGIVHGEIIIEGRMR